MAIIFLRTLIVFFLIMLAMRIMGKRQLGELEPSELVAAVLISDISANPLEDMGIPLIYGILPALTLLSCEVLISAITLKSIRLRSLLGDVPSIVISHGKINQKEMRKNRFNIDELTSELRKQGVTDISSIQTAVLEPDGSISILLYPSECPVTPAQLNIDSGNSSYPVILINDGHIIDGNLKLLGIDRAWLDKELKKRNIESPEDVFLLTSDSSFNIYVDEKDKT
ncbi:MAG: DUF421 domain-containing protein [Oscillospiraceae bacterium]|nr:DUF421 domain-containing protein [Oscillospiraceae bacterium]